MQIYDNDKYRMWLVEFWLAISSITRWPGQVHRRRRVCSVHDWEAILLSTIRYLDRDDNEQRFKDEGWLAEDTEEWEDASDKH